MSEPCPVAHISTDPGWAVPATAVRRVVDRETGEVAYSETETKGVLSFAGRVVDCKPVLAPRKAVGGGERGAIRCWSAASRRRLLYLMASLDFRHLARTWGGRFVFMTLTYLEDPGPAEVARQRNVFLMRLGRRQGVRRWVWKLEFQRRGVPHMHVLLWVPKDDAGDLADLRKWTWDAWDDVSGGYVKDGKRGMHRVDVDWCRAKDVARYLAFDLTKSSKGYQFRVPQSWSGTGRWWGVSGLAPEWLHAPLGIHETISVRRLLRRYRKANSRAKARFGRCRGLSRVWVIGEDSGTLMAAVENWLANTVSARGLRLHLLP